MDTYTPKLWRKGSIEDVKRSLRGGRYTIDELFAELDAEKRGKDRVAVVKMIERAILRRAEKAKIVGTRFE